MLQLHMILLAVPFLPNFSPFWEVKGRWREKCNKGSEERANCSRRSGAESRELKLSNEEHLRLLEIALLSEEQMEKGGWGNLPVRLPAPYPFQYFTRDAILEYIFLSTTPVEWRTR